MKDINADEQANSSNTSNRRERALVEVENKIEQRDAELEAPRTRFLQDDAVSRIDFERTMSDLMTREEQYHLLVEGVQDYAIFMLDPVGRIISWNSGARQINGYEESEILGKHFSCFYLAVDAAAKKPEKELEIAKSEGRYEEEGKRVRKSGQVFWASVVITPLWDDLGVLRGFAKVTRDISARKSAEEKTRLMVELAINAMILVDARGLLVQVNPQTEKLFGYSQEELLGKPVEMLVPESFQQKHPAQRDKFFANPSVRDMGAGRDLHARRKDGTEFSVEIGLNPIDIGDELLVIGSIVDITERKRAEEKARLHLAELAHAGRLSTVGEMFSGLAHEINQPLAAASNYARACVRMAKSKNGATREQLQEWLEKTAAQAERASEIVKRLGTFMKKERSTRSELNVNRLIETVLALPVLLTSPIDGSTPANVRVELQEPLPLIVADKVQIEQVLVNLIRNANEAMAGIEGVKRRLTVKTEQKNRVIQVSVSDTGHGIPLEVQAQLFKPFFTTKADGMGLGLSISRSIIETHRGEMFIKSSPGNGTTIVFQLPIEDGEETR